MNGIRFASIASGAWSACSMRRAPGSSEFVTNLIIGEQPDGGELGAAREDERRERLRLDEREARAARRDRVGKRERDDAEPERHHREESAPERAVARVRVHPLDPRDAADGPVRAAKAVRHDVPSHGGGRTNERETPPAAASGGVSE